MANKMFFGFGLVTVLAAIYLIIEQDYVIGLCGLATGGLIVYQNWLTLKDKVD